MRDRWLALPSPVPVLLLAALVAALHLPGAARAQEAAAEWPARVLITNDDGIDSEPLRALAEAFSEVTETWVVAPSGNRSGSTNLMPAFSKGRFEVERRDLGEGINAFAVNGYPADCLLFAFTGPMRGRLPDLVISGVNGGSNVADAWFLSGTIGAARTAAYLGVPAISVSGVVEDDPESRRAVAEWVVALARSPAVRRLEAPQYLTVSLPVAPPGEIEGVSVTRRADGLYLNGVATHETRGQGRDARDRGARQVWELQPERPEPSSFDASTDVRAVAGKRIAVVPMRVDEHDEALLEWLEVREDALPEWSATAAVPADAEGR